MKLRDLDAKFIRYETRMDTWRQVLPGVTYTGEEYQTEEVPGPREFMVDVETLAEAKGVFLQCPICRQPDGSGHYLQVTFANRGVGDSQGSHGKDGGPTRWEVSGTGLDDLTTKPSILLDGGCNWHGYITNGDAA